MKTPSTRLFATLVGGWIVSAALVCAAADSVFHDQPASPRSLPADNLPPFGMLDEHGQLVPTPRQYLRSQPRQYSDLFEPSKGMPPSSGSGSA
jgi:hypothetical protein